MTIKIIIISLFQPSLLTFSTHISLGLFLYYGNSFYYDLIFNVLIHKAMKSKMMLADSI